MRVIRRVVCGRVVGGRVADVYVRALFAAAFALLAASAARADAVPGAGAVPDLVIAGIR